MSVATRPAAFEMECERCGGKIEPGEFYDYDDESLVITHEEGKCESE